MSLTEGTGYPELRSVPPLEVLGAAGVTEPLLAYPLEVGGGAAYVEQGDVPRTGEIKLDSEGTVPDALFVLLLVALKYEVEIVKYDSGVGAAG